MANKSIIGDDTGCNMKQELFCKLYVSIGSSTFGNASKSYTEAKFKAKNAANGASELMRKPYIRKRIAELYAEMTGELGITAEMAYANLMHSLERARAGDNCTTTETSLVRSLIALVIGLKDPRAVPDEIEEQSPAQRRASIAAAEAFKYAMTHEESGVKPSNVTPGPLQ